MSTPNPASKAETQGSGGRKTLPAPEQTLKCPRCDSPNTKFCYYNNYSLTQPRHFCKTCRRYWTKGGALRNVPIGGGCRKNKKHLKSKDSGDSSSDSGGFKLLNGLSPAMDFQLGGLNLTSPSSASMKTSGYNNFTSHYTQFSLMGDQNSTNSSSVLGLDPLASGSLNPLPGFNFGGSALNFHNTNNNLASSIESLSSINQDLHWKLQQQRLAVLFGVQEGQRKTEENNSVIFDNQKPQPILFENLEISKQGCVNEGGNSSRTEWFFDNNNISYAPVNLAVTTPANSGSTTGNEMNGSSWSTGVQAWSTSATNNLNQYSSLP